MAYRGDDERLFGDGDLHPTLEIQQKKMLASIGGYDGNKLLNTPEDDLAEYFASQFGVEPVELDEEGITADQSETSLPIDRIPDGRFRYSDSTTSVKATRFSFFVPYQGDSNIFKLRGSSWSMNPPRATVRANQVVLNFTTHQPDAQQIRREFDKQLGQIKSGLKSVNQGVTAFNTALRAKALSAIQGRKQSLLKAQDTVSELGFPLRRRAGAPKTYAAPAARRKVKPSPPPASSAPYKPEPALPTEEYEHILSVIQNMGLVLERSPSAFETMGEEDLRQHFLVQLNGQYEGTATGETFNAAGKTDILIRHEGKNLFIGECKFWKGPKQFRETVDQLLGYTCWRDTKTAIIVFNRGTAQSTVLSKIPEELRAYPHFKRELEIEGETLFRVVLHQPDDPNRELIVTVLVFDVPSKPDD